MKQLHISIIGAGIGGLCLAQMLKQAHIAFDVFERDPAPNSRTQGYRIRIDADGQLALAASLPDTLHLVPRDSIYCCIGWAIFNATT
ncbi:NAD(P)-binding protein [Acinetobacter baumannii]|uniref:NAD(P)-binding protein n=1 Tax=Acinetobacter baumannii TaxID=470 RepID=UPI002958666C|nr:NAD(P)-binding protein [Acinetobacter baumannii]WNX60033.1 NAD(P)-binding protein [Acinetobacter baumannii]